MKVTYGWVREFVDLALPAAEAADRLVNAGIEVASVARLAPADLAGVVVGEVEAIDGEVGGTPEHRLLLCRVTTGRARYAVVCGAPNVRVGLRSAFAPPGATLPGGHRVETVKIRKTESQGMLCSPRDLGLGDDHEGGVLALDADAPLGADLVSHLGLDDAVLEIEITPNRPDCLSVVGIARELAALTGARFRVPAVTLKETEEAAASLATVRVEAPDLCRRYTARVITGLTVGPSPAWIAARLRAVGLRPISNVVDITNYV
ncbi:MAG: phenylalanine--tRNA ligase beta subunit-related protein, partial [Candidatus Rokuibacteriota bacterium]